MTKEQATRKVYSVLKAHLGLDLLKEKKRGCDWINLTDHPEYRLRPQRDQNKLRKAAEEVLADLEVKATDPREVRTARVR